MGVVRRFFIRPSHAAVQAPGIQSARHSSVPSIPQCPVVVEDVGLDRNAPEEITALNEVPTNPVGKVDRVALPQLADAAVNRHLA